MTANPSPFEPGYEPPPGARLSPLPEMPVSDGTVRESASDTVPGAPPVASDSDPHWQYGPPEGSDSPPKRSALTAVFTLLIGLVIGFAAGFFFSYESQEDAAPTPSLSPSVAPTAAPDDVDLDDIGADAPDPLPLVTVDPRFQDGLEIYSSDGELRFGHNWRGSTAVNWGTTFFTDAWSITTQAPRDVTDELLEYDPSNRDLYPGNRYYLVELEVARIGDGFEAPGTSIDLAFLPEVGVILESCASYPDRLPNADPMHPGDKATVNMCMSLPKDQAGRWQFQIDGRSYFHIPQSDLEDHDFSHAR